MKFNKNQCWFCFHHHNSTSFEGERRYGYSILSTLRCRHPHQFISNRTLHEQYLYMQLLIVLVLIPKSSKIRVWPRWLWRKKWFRNYLRSAIRYFGYHELLPTSMHAPEWHTFHWENLGEKSNFPQWSFIFKCVLFYSIKTICATLFVCRIR